MLKRLQLTTKNICLVFLGTWAIILLQSTSLLAQQAQPLQVNHIATKIETNKLAWLKHQQDGMQSDPALILLQLSMDMDATQKQSLRQNGMELQEYIGNRIYNAFLYPGANIEAIATNAAITGFAAVQPRHKIVAAVQEKMKHAKRSVVLISFHKGISNSSILSVITKNGGKILPNSLQQKGLYKIDIPSANINRLAAYYGLKYISLPTQNIPLDYDSKGGEGATLLSIPVGLGGKGLTGSGIVIGHGDNTSGIYHIDQTDRVVNFNPASIIDHGVLTNGIIGGDGIVDPAGQGIATDAVFLSHYFDEILAVQDAMRSAYNMTLTNNSYAAVVGDCSYAGTYDNLSQLLDSMAIALPDVLDVFAAGNDGRLGCGGYAPGYANVCGGYQTAKNILDVGAIDRNLVVGLGSSRGPIKDGRLKPEMTAVGMDILCPVPDNTYTITRGTSLSCPQVTGALALLSQRYKQLHSGVNPRSDLLKALLLNGASDLGNPGPDFVYGFGFLDLYRSMTILENGQYTRRAMPAGSAPQTFTIDVPANTAQLKVMLYYHDPVASAASTTQLVNDLDLTVIEPGGTVHKPLVLDPSISGVGKNATERADHLNNAEQVTINNPVAGTYTLSVSDYSIPYGPQDYVVVYDAVPVGLHLLYPVANAASPADTAMYIYWDASPDSVNKFRLDYTTDGGANWNAITDTLSPNTHAYKWSVPTINSVQCKVRLTRAFSSDISGLFAINTQPVVTLATDQCPGSISINWTAVPNVSKYYMLLKKGPHFQIVDSVAATSLSYTFSGLDVNTTYWVAVQPNFTAMNGFRSKGISARPNVGACAAVAHGDMAIDSLVSPQSGRKYTSSALGPLTPLKVNVHNFDNLAVADYSVSLQVNGGTWIKIPSLSIPANSSARPVIDYLDLRDTISYTIAIAVHNNDRPDPVHNNDTIVRVIKHLPNNPVNLVVQLNNDFETIPDFTLLHDSVGISKDGYWDYTNNTDTGRLRTTIPGSRHVTSKRSISLDVNEAATTNVNYFTGTFNLSKYDTASDEIRFDFDYEMRGMPVLKDSNRAWVRGADTNSWIPVFTYSNVKDTGRLLNSGTLSIKDMLAKNGQNYSPSTQIRFGQYDSTLIADDSYGGGVTIDNVRLYKVGKDIALTDILAPALDNCNISSSAVIIKIKNGTTNAVSGIMASYKLDGNPVVTELLKDTIKGKDSLIYRFLTGLSSLSFGNHKLMAWVHIPGDDYSLNDTMLNYIFNISSQIDTFPYLQNFEVNDGNWYVRGVNSSWAYGTPTSPKINKAASGAKAWKTNLSGNYNNGEKSYLYSPCISTSRLTSPMLSFSLAFDIEHCDGSFCDGAYLEFSVDNEKTWNKLGFTNSGTNWYNDNTNQVWSGLNNTRWHVASYLLPKSAQLKLRFAFTADPGSNFEGIALDDIHIFDHQQPIYEFADNRLVADTEAANGGTSWIDFIQSSTVFSALQPQSQNLGVATATAYKHNNVIDDLRRQYIMPRNFVLKTDIPPVTDMQVRLFITDNEVNAILLDTTCSDCSKPEDIYRTGVTRYREAGQANEDSLLSNNNAGQYTYYPYSMVKWVPYDKGYYAELTTNAPGEFWLNDGGFSQSLPVNSEFVLFNARRLHETQALLTWSSVIDTVMATYLIQRSADSVNFTNVKMVGSLKNVTFTYSEIDDTVVVFGTKTYYRLLCTTTKGNTFYTPVRVVTWDKNYQLNQVFPNPNTDGNVNISWTATPGTVAALQLTDVAGRSIFQSELIANDWDNLSTLHLGALPKGVYLLKMNIEGNKFVEKVTFK